MKTRKQLLKKYQQEQKINEEKLVKEDIFSCSNDQQMKFVKNLKKKYFTDAINDEYLLENEDVLMRLIQLYINCTDGSLLYNIGTVLVNFTCDEENTLKYFNTEIIKEIVQKFTNIPEDDVESLEANIFLFSNISSVSQEAIQYSFIQNLPGYFLEKFIELILQAKIIFTSTVWMFSNISEKIQQNNELFNYKEVVYQLSNFVIKITEPGFIAREYINSCK